MRFLTYFDELKSFEKCLNLGMEDDAELVISLGGDGHFLNCANFIKNKNTSILGINTSPKNSFGFLNEERIYPECKSQTHNIGNNNSEFCSFMIFNRSKMQNSILPCYIV